MASKHQYLGYHVLIDNFGYCYNHPNINLLKKEEECNLSKRDSHDKMLRVLPC